MKCSTPDHEGKGELDDLVEWEQIRRRIGIDLEMSAYESRALVRRREIQNAGDLLRMVLAYSLKDLSLEMVGMWAFFQKIGMFSKTAVRQRLRNCAGWMGMLLAGWLQKRCTVLSETAGVVVRIMDATIISPPGIKGTGWRVHLNLDLGRMCVSGVELSDAHGGETLARVPPQKGEIRIADRGYAFVTSMLTVLNEAFLVVRINWQNPLLLDSAGQRFDPVLWIQRLSAPAECQVQIATSQGNFGLRLLACPLPPEAVQAAQRKARREASRKKYLIKTNTLIAAGYLLLLTNLPGENWPIQRVFWLYRIRWQVELYFKRLKSILTLDHLHAQDPALIQTYLLAKLLAALILDDLSQQVKSSFPDWFLDLDRPVSVWRLTALLWTGFCDLVYGPLSLAKIISRLPALRRHLCDPPRRRPQQLAWAQAFLQHLSSSSYAFP